MENIKIVEYSPAYARAVAEMWVKSAEGFNGENCDETEESVLATHAKSTDLNTYLAVLGDEVLGYCGFSKYLKDEGALHIRLLNVRYDKHGKGIGKLLVKKAVERTIELNWPRLDLYTWSGNTKAIPLYKKCGYFLENRQDTTHLMNFIPTVMNTEAVKDYFATTNWYDDMKRIIDIEPDGRLENGFDFYEYKWEKDSKKLRMEFEKKGRGLRLIETDDYLIMLSTTSQNLIFNRSYRASFEIINKTGKPLNIELTGKDDKNIKFPFSKEIDVKGREFVEAEFYVAEPEAELSSFKTHPGVTAEVMINGKSALFKLGIAPKPPAILSLKSDDYIRHSGESFNVYMDIESYLDEAGTFEFELPASKDIEFPKRKFRIELSKGGKTSLPIECRLNNPCFYQVNMNVLVILSSGEKLQFNRKIGFLNRGQNHLTGCDIDDKYIIANGIYKLTLNKNYNQVEVYYREQKKDITIMYPKLGLPFSDEFSNMKIGNVKWFSEHNKIILCGEYSSKAYKDIIIKAIFCLSSNGLIEQYFEVTNASSEETNKEIYLRQSIHQRIEGATIPYNNKIVHDTEPCEEYPGRYINDKFNENWIFADRTTETEALIWPQNMSLDYNGWYMSFEHNIGLLKGYETKVTQPIYLALSTFKNWKETRNFALGENSLSTLAFTEDFEININNSNPFVNDDFMVNIIENKSVYYSGEVTVKSENESFEKINIKLETPVNTLSIPIKAGKALEKDIIYTTCDFGTISLERKNLVFHVKNDDINSEIIEENKLKIYSVDNGCMCIKASPQFSTGIFSLQFMGKEWLDNSFPNYGPKSWYNPWFGGIQNIPEDLIENARTLPKENVYMEFIEMQDSLGNKWKGLKTSFCFANEENYNGLEVTQYYLMLPGVPLLLSMTELTNGMHKYMDNDTFTNIAFLKTGEEIKNSWVRVKSWQGEVNQYRPGTRNYEISPYSSPLYGCDALDYKVQVNIDYEKSSQWVYLSAKDFACYNRTNVCLAQGEKKQLPYVFYTFTKNHIPDKLLKSLKNISFE